MINSVTDYYYNSSSDDGLIGLAPYSAENVLYKDIGFLQSL